MKLTRIPLAALVGAGCLVLGPGAASAESSVGLDLTFFSSEVNNATLTLISPQLHVMVGVGETFALGLDWAIPYASVSADAGGMSESEGRFNVGNPFIAAYYRMNLSDNLRLRVGGGVALPLAQIPDDDVVAASLALLGYVGAYGTRGARDVWLYIPESVGFATPVSLEVTGGPLMLGADAAIAVIVPTGDSNTDETDVLIQLSPKAGFNLGLMTVGARLTEVLILTGDEDDKSQLSIEPFVEANVGSVKLLAAFNINIDAPAGFSFDDGRFWGFTVGASAGF